MTEANALVAEAEASDPLKGAGVFGDVGDLCKQLSAGDWLAADMAGIGVVIDGAASLGDPLGSLIAAGAGWLMEHLEPLKGWLNDLTGDGPAVAAFAKTWEHIAEKMRASAEDLDRAVAADLAAMSGASITAYAAYAKGLADQIRATGEAASAISSALETCSAVVQFVHDLVRDTLAALVGAIISWLAEEMITVGVATPVVVAQVSTRVASESAKVGKGVTDVTESVSALGKLLTKFGESLRSIKIHKPGEGSLGRLGEAVVDVGRKDVPNAIKVEGASDLGPTVIDKAVDGVHKTADGVDKTVDGVVHFAGEVAGAGVHVAGAVAGAEVHAAGEVLGAGVHVAGEVLGAEVHVAGAVAGAGVHVAGEVLDAGAHVVGETVDAAKTAASDVFSAASRGAESLADATKAGASAFLAELDNPTDATKVDSWDGANNDAKKFAARPSSSP